MVFLIYSDNGAAARGVRFTEEEEEEEVTEGAARDEREPNIIEQNSMA